MSDPGFPRPLRPKERELLESVLPIDRPGYRAVRAAIAAMSVIAEGRRGPGNLVLGAPGAVPDLAAPPAPVIACGMLESTREHFAVTVREPAGGQIDIEIVSGHLTEVPDHFEEKRRWSYSQWSPGDPSPESGAPVREVRVDRARTLAICVTDRRLWLHDGESGIVHPIPVTNYYNELMLLKSIRDPGTALRSSLLFEQVDRYADADLRAAFIAYNAVRRRVEIRTEPAPTTPGGLRALLRRVISSGEQS